MKEIKFTVFGEPKAKGRPRFFAAKVGPGKKPFVRTYTPKETVEAEQDVRVQSLKTRPKTLILGSISMTIDVYRKIPKSLSKTKIQDAEDKKLLPISRPDWDNYGKLVCDALNGVYYKDDSQITEAIVRKFYSSSPRLEVTISYQEMEGGE